MFCRKYIKNRFDKRKKPFAGLKSVKQKDGEKILVFLTVIFDCKVPLSGFQRKQILSKTSVFSFVAQFFNIKCKCKHKKLCFDILFSSHQETFKAKVLFEYPKYSFYLNRSVDPQLCSFFCCNIIKRFLSLSHKFR